jgi:hypothetical protein
MNRRATTSELVCRCLVLVGTHGGWGCDQERPSPATTKPSASANPPGASWRVAPPTPAAPAASVAEAVKRFGQRIDALSEPDRDFFSDNLVSNEASYLDSVPWLEAARAAKGVYIGVGPEQNLTYLAHLRPRLAYIVDIRRDNLLLHLLYKSLFEDTTTRSAWLAMLLGRRLEAAPPVDSANVEALLAAVDRAPLDPSVHRSLVDRTLERMHERWAFRTQPEDETTLQRMCRAFYNRQLALRFETTASPRPGTPTFAELLRARDASGRQLGFLATDAGFEFLRQFSKEDRLVPVVGDLAGSHALAAIARELVERRLRVSIFYASNVEQYLLMDGKWAPWLDNLRTLPHDNRSMVLRSYSDRKAPHPAAAGKLWVQLAQPWDELVASTTAPGSYRELALRSQPSVPAND